MYRLPQYVVMQSSSSLASPGPARTVTYAGAFSSHTRNKASWLVVFTVCKDGNITIKSKSEQFESIFAQKALSPSALLPVSNVKFLSQLCALWNSWNRLSSLGYVSYILFTKKCMLIVWKDDKHETYLQEKPIAQAVNLEQVISEEMPRILSPVIFVEDIDPSFYRLIPPVHGHVHKLNNFGYLRATWWKNYVWTTLAPGNPTLA